MRKVIHHKQWVQSPITSDQRFARIRRRLPDTSIRAIADARQRWNALDGDRSKGVKRIGLQKQKTTPQQSRTLTSRKRPSKKQFDGCTTSDELCRSHRVRTDVKTGGGDLTKLRRHPNRSWPTGAKSSRFKYC